MHGTDLTHLSSNLPSWRKLRSARWPQQKLLVTTGP